ncbi:YwmB family TATA-box binding protein [Niallia sp. 01092]|uniref:YwmB family TATA-box binding protein n=1 Tax=unclassified Niallia TaxID=2837522 RepID=UPI003FD46EDC
MNKIFYITFTIFMGFAVWILGYNTINAHTQLDLFTINEILKNENGIQINEWSLNAREKLENVTTIQDAKNYQELMKEKFPTAKWQETKNRQSWQMKALLRSNKNMEESIIITTSLTTKTSQSYIIYEAKGKELKDETNKKLQQQIEENISAIFRGEPTIFSCIKGEFNDKINESLPYYVNHLLSVFQAKQIEALKENEFISTSAYTPIFEETVHNSKEAMNLQLGIRTQGMGGKTTIVVGTPIITIEY